MWQERGKTTHLKVAKKWGKEEREGSSFVLPQLLHHSAVSSWISGLTAAEKCSVPRSVSWCSGPGQQLFLQIRAKGMLQVSSVTFSVTHLLPQHWQFCLLKRGCLFICSTQILCFQYCSLPSAQSNPPTKNQWNHLSPTVCHTSGVSSSVASFTVWFFEFSSPQAACLLLLFCFLNCSVLF